MNNFLEIRTTSNHIITLVEVHLYIMDIIIERMIKKNCCAIIKQETSKANKIWKELFITDDAKTIEKQKFTKIYSSKIRDHHYFSHR